MKPLAYREWRARQSSKEIGNGLGRELDLCSHAYARTTGISLQNKMHTVSK